jgi:hypothetical protein
MKQKHVKLFEQFMDGGTESGTPASGQYATCISSDGGWSAVGILFPEQEKYVQELQDLYGDEILIVRIPANEDGAFIALDGEGGGFKLFKDGDRYQSNLGYVFPILQGKMFIASAAGHTVDFDIVDPSKLKNL